MEKLILAEDAHGEEMDSSINVTLESFYTGHKTSKRKQIDIITVHNSPKKSRSLSQSSANNGPKKDSKDILSDVYCWECHKECVENACDCSSCPRTFHADCLRVYDNPPKVSNDDRKTCVCPVCESTSKAAGEGTMLKATKHLDADQLCIALGYALKRMKHPESEFFHKPVSKSVLSDYYDIIFHPLDLSAVEQRLKTKYYTSTTAFFEDVKWILHNSMIYNGVSSKYTTDAKLIIKICKHEMSEIELCPVCYLNSCIRVDSWFTEPCTVPHCLVWAKLKGFPFWPAKALQFSQSNNVVDVRFFGAHDRAWIPTHQIYLLSEECPVPMKNVKKFGFDKAFEEVRLHMRNLKCLPGMQLQYAPFKTAFKAEHIDRCVEMFGRDFFEQNHCGTILPSSPAIENEKVVESQNQPFSKIMNDIQCVDSVVDCLTDTIVEVLPATSTHNLNKKVKPIVLRVKKQISSSGSSVKPSLRSADVDKVIEKQADGFHHETQYSTPFRARQAHNRTIFTHNERLLTSTRRIENLLLNLNDSIVRLTSTIKSEKTSDGRGSSVFTPMSAKQLIPIQDVLDDVKWTSIKHQHNIASQLTIDLATKSVFGADVLLQSNVIKQTKGVTQLLNPRDIFTIKQAVSNHLNYNTTDVNFENLWSKAMIALQAHCKHLRSRAMIKQMVKNDKKTNDESDHSTCGSET